MAINLTDPKLKAARVKEHLESLRAEHSTFTKTNPYSIRFEEDVENGLYLIRPHVEEVPARISLIVGDLFYALRSSLDQLVYCLAKLTTPTPKHTQFPIFAVNDKDSAARFGRYTTGVPAEAVSIIESLQPYNGRDASAVRSHALWTLNAMCNIDKHRRIPVNGHGLDVNNILTAACFKFIQVLYDNNGVATGWTVPLHLKSQVNLQPTFRLHIMFGDYTEGVACEFPDIERIYEFVANHLLPAFARFFE